MTPKSNPISQHNAPSSWRSWLWVILGGLFFGASQPLVLPFLGEHAVDPTGLSGLLAFVAFVPALVLMRNLGAKRAYWIGFFTMWAGTTLILYWAYVAITVFGRLPAAVGLAATLLFSGTVSFIVASSFAVTRVIVRGLGIPQWITFPICFAGTYFLLNYGPVGGFPWTAPAYALTRLPLLLQGASLIGVYGLTAWIALLNAVFAECFVAWRNQNPMPQRALLSGVVTTVLVLGWGAHRLQSEDSSSVPTIKVALLQGNIEQGIKNKSAQNATMILEKYHRLQNDALAQGAELVVWPEAALPKYIRARSRTLQWAGVTPAGEDAPVPQAAVVGAVVLAPSSEPVGASGRKYARYNSAVFMGQEMKVLGRLDKAHLVPFGEYVPWPLNVILQQLVPGGSTFGEQRGPIEMVVGDQSVKLGATICYEGIFPEITRRFTAEGAQLMLNLTNDAWYGVSSAALQHLSMYSMRAVESGRAVARAANTGITAWIDPFGRVHDATEIYTDAMVIADIPLQSEQTPYVRFGDWVAFPCAILALLSWFGALVGPFWRRKRSPIDWGLGVGFTLAASLSAAGYFIFVEQPSEADANRATVAVVAALLIGLGALSGRPWGRTAQIWVGGLAFLFCAIAAYFDTPYWVVLALVGILVAGVAMRRKGAYQRDIDLKNESLF